MRDYEQATNRLASALRHIIDECRAERERIGTASASPYLCVGVVWGWAEEGLRLAGFEAEEAKDDGTARPLS
ncbi:MAG: hypothetical protein AB1760_00140 [Pseudomonadota bacterium]